VGTTSVGDGGDVRIAAGLARSPAAAGGSVTIAGGEGADPDLADGGNGGGVRVLGGEARGMSASDAGGAVELQGGLAAGGRGGRRRGHPLGRLRSL
jgi:hypothetical protein